MTIKTLKLDKPVIPQISKPYNDVQPKEGEISVSAEQLSKIKLMIATPCYGGMATGAYMDSCLKLVPELIKYGVGYAFYFMFNESLITRARNYCADAFLSNPVEFTHLLFIDSDIEFHPDSVMSMLAMSILNEDKGIFVGPYPKKSIAFEKIKQAVDSGKADENPFELEKYAGDFVIGRFLTDKAEIKLNEIVEVSEAGTGFMLIKRQVLLDFAIAHPELYYKPDHVRSKDFNGDREICQFFNAEIDLKSKRYLSEDYYFCYKAKDLGWGTYLLPWVQLNHIGSYRFVGNLPAVAQLGASLTVDEKSAKKQRDRS